LTLWDYLVLALYGATVLALGCFSGRGHQRSDELFLGGRRLPAWAVLFSMVATELSAATFLGVPHAAYLGDWAYLQLAFGALLGKLVLGVYVIPLYYRSGSVTVYGLLEQRYGSLARRAAAVAFVGGRIVASGVRLFIAALAFAAVTGLDLDLAVVSCGGIAGAYTLAGGIRAVIWTDVLQGCVFIAAALAVVTTLGVHPHGGWVSITAWAAQHGRMQVFHFAPLFSLGDARPFFVGLIGGFFLTLATHGTDYDMVQRLLTTRSGKAGGWALIGSALLNFPITVLFLAIGTGIAAVYQTTPPYEISDASQILPLFSLHELAPGARGLLFAGLFAAAMSSLDSAVCAIATTVSVDVLSAARDEAVLVRRMRLASIVSCVALVGAALGFARYYAVHLLRAPRPLAW